MDRVRLALVCVAAVAAGCQTAPQPAPKQPLPFDWSTPSGWRSETIPFPLDFAENLPLTGLEELRFAPGMFKPEQPGYWSYAFVWWLEGKPALTAIELQDHLYNYFVGLTTAVGKDKNFVLQRSRFATQMQSAPAPESKSGHPVDAFVGTADLYDAFTTGQPIHLNLDVWVWDCSHKDHRVAVVLASPQASDTPIWNELRARRSEMACHQH
jgi:hypothetical protein